MYYFTTNIDNITEKGGNLCPQLSHHENDPKTYGGLFFALCEDVQDMELSDALRSLMNLFLETINGYGTEDTEIIKSKVVNWIASQSRYIKGLFQNLCWEN